MPHGKLGNKMITTVLITGATGFIGSHLTWELLKREKHVIILKRSSSKIDRIKDIIGKVKTYDVDTQPLQKVFQENKIDAVMHLATHYKKKHAFEDIKPTIATNITFPAELLELMKQHNVKHFINTGSAFVYEPKEEGAIQETTKKVPYNLYASSKIAFEEVLKHYTTNEGIKAVTLQLFSPYGEQDQKKLIIALIEAMQKDTEMNIFSGEQKLNWTYVHDIVDAYCKTLDFIPNMVTNYEEFNIASDEVCSIKQLIQYLEEITQKKIKVTFTNSASHKIIFYSEGDNTKAKEKLGWDPQYNIKEGLQKTVSFYKV